MEWIGILYETLHRHWTLTIAVKRRRKGREGRARDTHKKAKSCIYRVGQFRKLPKMTCAHVKASISYSFFISPINMVAKQNKNCLQDSR